MFDKWRMITTILKIKEGSTDSALVTSTVQAFVDRSSRAFSNRIAELEVDVAGKRSENADLKLSIS